MIAAKGETSALMDENRRLTALLLAAAALLLAAPQALRAEGPIPVQVPNAREACLEDYRRFCQGVPPGGGRIVICLNAHADEISQRCFQALTVRGLAYAGALKACQLDYRLFCAGVPPGYGRGLQCLLGNAGALSPPCRSALEGHELLGPDAEGPDWDK
jgi:hypothetical protein